MNKRKVAVFVEGQTELVFVREFLVKWFCYETNLLGFDCYTLLRNEFCDVAYTYGSLDSENYYMIVNVGNDCTVLGKIRDRIQQLDKLGYQLVVGLRDMYSAQYIKDANGRHIDDVVTQLHIETVHEQIGLIPQGKMIDFHFAIMEVEAWLLGMYAYLMSVNKRLTKEYIEDSIGVDLEEDPEKTIFHPAMELNRIYGLVGKRYEKHLSDISAIMSLLKKNDFAKLIESGKCNTFKLFAESLLGCELSHTESERN